MVDRIRFHYGAFNQLRRSVQAELDSAGQAIAAAAGGSSDFQVISSPSKTRARTIVVTATERAKRAEATDRALTRALDAGRG